MSGTDIFTLTKRGLVTVMNEANIHNKSLVTIHSPLIELPLCETDLTSCRVSSFSSRGHFENAIDHFNLSIQQLRDDLPNYGDLRECLTSSSLIKYQNQSNIEKAIADATRRTEDWRKQPKKLFIGLDTNMLYLHFPSRHIKMGSPLCHVYSIGVDKELAHKIRAKYNVQHMREFKKNLHSHTPFESLFNSPMKESRKAKSARVEITYVKNVLGGLKASCEQLTSDKEENDTLIVESYGRFARDNGADLIFLTADRDIVDKANAEELECINFVQPNQIPRSVDGNPINLMHFLHDLSVVFGVIDLRGLGIPSLTLGIAELSGK